MEEYLKKGNMRINTLFGEIEIEGLSKEVEEINNIKNDIEKENVIDEIEVETITPLITGGYNGNQDSIIRATEIKAVLRWFVRYVLFCAIQKREMDKEEAVKKLNDIFGGNSKNSFFDIIVEPIDITFGNFEFENEGRRIKIKGIKIYGEDFGHRIKGLKDVKFINVNSRLKIIFIKNRDLRESDLKGKEKDIIKLFELIISIFGFGRLYRRGFGKVYSKKFNLDLKLGIEELQKLIKEIFNVEITVGYSEDEWKSNDIKVYNLNGKPININDCDLIIHRLHVCDDYLECLEFIANAVKRKNRNLHNTIYVYFLGTPKISNIPPVTANNRGITIHLPNSYSFTLKYKFARKKIYRGLYIYENAIPFNNNRNYRISIGEEYIQLDKKLPNKDLKIPSLIIYTIQKQKEEGKYIIYSVILPKGKLFDITHYLLHIGFSYYPRPPIVNEIYIERMSLNSLEDILGNLLKMGYIF